MTSTRSSSVRKRQESRRLVEVSPRRRVSVAWIALLPFILPGCVHEPVPVVALPPRAEAPKEIAAIDEAIRNDRLPYAIVRLLTTEVGPRLSGSTGDKLAVDWALRTMQRLGLKNVHKEAVTVPVWARGVESVSVVSPVARPLAATALGWSGATPKGGVTAEVVRFGTFEALQAAVPEQIRGKIVFLDAPMTRTRNEDGYDRAVRGRGLGASVAQAKGAAAFVMRSVGTDHSRAPHTGVTHQLAGAVPALGAALSVADADLLARLLETSPRVELHVELEPSQSPDAESANVVGEVVGREHPEEVVLLGAHLDSWDLGEGAVDDGAGCGIVLGAAAAIAKLPVAPRRTVRVVLFAAEETSGAGSRAYAAAHEAEAARIMVAAEADSGADRVYRFRGAIGRDALGELHAIARLLEPLGIDSDDAATGGGSDVSKLRALGVPIFHLMQDSSRYFDVHHTAEDTLAQIDPEAIAQVTSAFARVAWASAETTKTFGRLEGADRSR